MSRHAAHQSDRLAEIHHKTIDVIEEALDKFSSDMHATEKKRSDGEWVEVPVMRLKPKDVAILIDRLLVLFERPSVISQHQGLSATGPASPAPSNHQMAARSGGNQQTAAARRQRALMRSLRCDPRPGSSSAYPLRRNLPVRLAHGPTELRCVEEMACCLAELRVGRWPE